MVSRACCDDFSWSLMSLVVTLEQCLTLPLPSVPGPPCCPGHSRTPLVPVCAFVHSARLARLLVIDCGGEHTATDRLAPHAVAYAANVTSAVWSPGCLKPGGLSWSVLESIATMWIYRATWIGTRRQPSFSLSDRPSWKAVVSRSSLERPQETEPLMCLLQTHY